MADVIDYKIHKSTMDLVEITLDPGEAVIIETGSMISMDSNIEMSAIVGDDSEVERGFFGKLIGSGKRIITGEGLFMTKLENVGKTRGNVLLSPGGAGSQVVPLDLSKQSSPFLCNKGHFLAAARGVHVGLGFKFKPITSMVGSAEIITQKLEGNGYAFLKSSGPAYTRFLKPGEKIKVDQHALVGMQETIRYRITFVKGIKSMLFSGEGLVLYEFEGPGAIVLQGYNELDLMREEKYNKIEKSRHYKQ